MAEFSQIADKFVTVFKTVGNILLILAYGLYCYLELFYRLIFPAPKKSLDGEILLVTGSSTGIGRAVVLRLAKEHPRLTLVLWDWNAQENKKTADEAKKLGAKKVFSYQIDVADRVKVEELAKKVQEEVGAVTILWNNAGIARVKDLLGSKPEDLEQTIHINLIAHFWTLRMFLPSMIENNHGHVVTTASLGSYLPARFGLAYFSAKFGLRGMIESLQDELRVHPRNPNKIKFTTIFPSFIRTPMTKRVVLKINNKVDEKAWLEMDEVVTRIIDGIQRNEEKVIIPSAFELVILFKSCVPSAFYKKINHSIFDGDYEEE